MEQSLSPSTKANKNKVVALSIILSILAIGITFLLLFNKPQTAKTINRRGSVTQTGAHYRQWINCDDIRDVIEENDNLYLACLGGVLILNSASGEVIGQISMTDGLNSQTTTSLVKKNSTLYIGTQDGFTKFDLNTRKAEKISINEGLVNGANIILAGDDNNLWVGSYNGLSKYDTSTGKITNFTGELADNSSMYGVNNILATPKAVYFSVQANAHSAGGIARFDKATSTWERFGPSAFQKTGQYSRMDLFYLINSEDKIYTGETSGSIWVSEDKQGTSWQPLKLPGDNFSRENGNSFNLVSGTTNSIFITDDTNFYTYDPGRGSIRKLNIQTGGQNLNNVFLAYRNGKIWAKNYDRKKGLIWVDPETQKTGSIKFKKRPASFEKLLALIDKYLIVLADGKIWQYDYKADKFEVFAEGNYEISPDSPSLLFHPIPGTQNILFLSQLCGMGCGKPEAGIINYDNKTITPLTFPENVLKLITESSETFGGTAYKEMVFYSYNAPTKTFNFYLGYEKKEYLRFDAPANTWKYGGNSNSPSDINEITSKISCNPVYTYGRKKVFNEPLCSKRLTYNSIDFNIDGSSKEPSIRIENKKTGASKTVVIPLEEPAYSPFPETSSPEIRTLKYENDILWIATNRGLASFSPGKMAVRNYSVKDGLVSNEVAEFIVDKNIIWALTTWGGLSNFTY